MKDTKSFILVTFLILIALYLVKVFDISYPLTIISTTRSSELSVVGEGKIEATPDTAYVDTGVAVNNEATVEAVQKKIDEANNTIIDALKGLGIKKEDIKTSNYSINPNYTYEAGENKIKGYKGNVTISIKMKDMKKVSDVVVKVTEVGANQVNGIHFAIGKQIISQFVNLLCISFCHYLFICAHSQSAINNC